MESLLDRNLYIDLLIKCLTGYLYPESSYSEIRPHRGMGAIKRTFLRGMNTRGYKIFKVEPFDQTARVNGLDWPNIGYSMVGLNRLQNLQSCVEAVLAENVPGDLIETGVWRGGACIFYAGDSQGA